MCMYIVLLLCCPQVILSPPSPGATAVICQWEMGGGVGLLSLCGPKGLPPSKSGSIRGAETSHEMPGSAFHTSLFGHLLLDVEQKLVVGERSLGAILHQMLEKTALSRRVIPRERGRERHGVK